MRIPITINGREDPLRRASEPLGLHERPEDPYGRRRTRLGTGAPEPLTRNRTPLAADDRTRAHDGDGRSGTTEALQADPSKARQEPCPGTEETDERWKDRYLRLRADFDNYRRNAEARKERLTGLGKETVLEDVFPLVEHMERAIRAAEDADGETGILEGLEMVYKELLRVLERHGVERVETVGTPFDPEIHDAVAVAPHREHPENTVVEELRAGFRRDGRLLRPASVMVAK